MESAKHDSGGGQGPHGNEPEDLGVWSQLPRGAKTGLQGLLLFAVALFWIHGGIFSKGCNSYLYTCQFYTALPGLADALFLGFAALFSVVYVGAKIRSYSLEYLIGALWLVLLFYYSMDTFFDSSVLNVVFMVLFVVIATRFWGGANSARRWGIAVGTIVLVWHGLDAGVHMTTWITGVAPADYIIANSRENSVTDLFLLLMIAAVLAITIAKGPGTRQNPPAPDTVSYPSRFYT